MTPELTNHRHFELQLARHAIRITALEDREKELKRTLDWLVKLLVSTLLAAVGGLVLQIAKH